MTVLFAAFMAVLIFSIFCVAFDWGHAYLARNGTCRCERCWERRSLR